MVLHLRSRRRTTHGWQRGSLRWRATADGEGEDRQCRTVANGGGGGWRGQTSAAGNGKGRWRWRWQATKGEYDGDKGGGQRRGGRRWQAATEGIERGRWWRAGAGPGAGDGGWRGWEVAGKGRPARGRTFKINKKTIFGQEKSRPNFCTFYIKLIR